MYVSLNSQDYEIRTQKRDTPYTTIKRMIYNTLYNNETSDI